MTILSSIANGSTGKDVRDTLNSQLPPLYLGMVARGYIPRSISTGTVYKSFNRQMRMRAMDNIATIQMLWTNWYLAANGVETSQGGTFALRASIQYPIAANPDTGTWQQLTWGGASTVNVADGGDTGLCDALTLLTAIPVGADFLIRTHEEFSNAGLFTYNGTINSLTTPCDTSTTANGTTDKTQGGTMQYTGYFIPNYPTLVVAQTRRASVFVPGDSRVSGGQDVDDAMLARGNICRSLLNVPHINLASYGETLLNFSGSGGAKRRAFAKYFSHMASNYGINDIATGNMTEANLLALIASTAGSLRSALAGGAGGKVLWATYEPEVSSTDSYVTVANQTKLLAAAKETIRVDVNALNRARQIANVDACIDIAAVVESATNSGLFTVLAQGTAAVAITNDGVHLNPIGNIMVANSRPVDPLILVR